MKFSESNIEYIVKEETPVLEIDASKRVNDTGKKLLKDTIVKGNIKKVFVKNNGKEFPVNFIELSDQKNKWIIPKTVNMYLGHFNNADGLGEVDKVGSNTKMNGQNNKYIDFTLKFILPLVGMAGAFWFAKKRGYDTKGIIMATAGGGLLMLTPFAIRKFIEKRKQK